MKSVECSSTDPVGGIFEGDFTKASLRQLLELHRRQFEMDPPATSTALTELTRAQAQEGKGIHPAAFTAANLGTIVESKQCCAEVLAAIEQKFVLMDDPKRDYDGLHCLHCGGGIGNDRLLARPWTTLCVTCQSANSYLTSRRVHVTVPFNRQLWAVFALLKICGEERHHRQKPTSWSSSVYAIDQFILGCNGSGLGSKDADVIIDQAMPLLAQIKSDSSLAHRSKILLREIATRLQT